MGVKDIHLFDPIDLYENKNMQRVVVCIHSLAAIVEREGLSLHSVYSKIGRKTQRNQRSS